MNQFVRRPEIVRGSVIGAVVCIPLIMFVATLVVDRGFAGTFSLRREVIRSYEARGDLQQILRLHLDLETGQRGFAITRDPRFLKPYLDSSSQIDKAFAQLDEDLPDDRSYTAALEELRRASEQKRRFVAQSIDLSRSGDEEAAQALVASGEGLRRMDHLRALIARIDDVERRQLERAIPTSDAAGYRLRNRFFALLALLVALLATAGFLVARGMASRDRARRQSDDLAARQEAIFESARDGMIVLNHYGRIDGINVAGARMFGLPAGDIVGRSIGVLFDVAPDRAEIESFLRRLEAGRAGPTGEFREFIGRRPDGAAFPLEVSLSVVPFVKSPQFLAICRDISERREVERLKGEFVATVSHELRTPLTSIAGSLGLVTGGAVGAIPPKAFRLIQIAHSNSARLVRLVNDILDIEKIEAGRMVFDLKPLDLGLVVQRAVRDNAGFAAEYGVRVDQARVPAGSLVLADEDRLIQVITNLLSNAVKFSPRNGVVRLCVDVIGDRYRISVADDGSGIPEAFRQRIFTKFAQADNSDARQKSGTGLGLSIVREIVQRLGGEVSYESEVGKGTVFHVDLPAAEQAPVATARDAKSLPPVLAVDDDPDVLRAVTDLFDGRAAIVGARSLKEARKAIDGKDFAAAILDIGLLDGSGLDLVPALRSRNQSMPIIVFTAQQADCAEGVDRLLTKSRENLERLADETMAMIHGRSGRSQ